MIARALQPQPPGPGGLAIVKQLAGLMGGRVGCAAGYEATRRIREDEQRRGQRTTIVALTADALDGDRERCSSAGMDAFMTKPVSSSQLSATIERWTGRRTQPATQW